MKKEQFSKEYHMVFLNEVMTFFVLLNHTWNNFTSANSDEYFDRMSFCIAFLLQFTYIHHFYFTSDLQE